MLILKDDNGNELPKKVQDRVNAFIDNLPNVPWFKPKPDLKKEEIEKQINFTLECFGVKAGIEYKKLQSKEDWDSARDSAWNSYRDNAWNSAWNNARDSVWDSTYDSARASAWDSVWDSTYDSARASAWDSVWDSTYDSARDSVWDSVCDSAWDSAKAITEILLEDNKDFTKKYPNGAFKQLFKLWEMGLYPIGVLKETGKFTVYIPPCSMDFPDDLIK